MLEGKKIKTLHPREDKSCILMLKGCDYCERYKDRTEFRRGPHLSYRGIKATNVCPRKTCEAETLFEVSGNPWACVWREGPSWFKTNPKTGVVDTIAIMDLKCKVCCSEVEPEDPDWIDDTQVPNDKDKKIVVEEGACAECLKYAGRDQYMTGTEFVYYGIAPTADCDCAIEELFSKKFDRRTCIWRDNIDTLGQWMYIDPATFKVYPLALEALVCSACPSECSSSGSDSGSDLGSDSSSSFGSGGDSCSGSGCGRGNSCSGSDCGKGSCSDCGKGSCSGSGCGGGGGSCSGSGCGGGGGSCSGSGCGGEPTCDEMFEKNGPGWYCITFHEIRRESPCGTCGYCENKEPCTLPADPCNDCAIGESIWTSVILATTAATLCSAVVDLYSCTYTYFENIIPDYGEPCEEGVARINREWWVSDTLGASISFVGQAADYHTEAEIFEAGLCIPCECTRSREGGEWGEWVCNPYPGYEGYQCSPPGNASRNTRGPAILTNEVPVEEDDIQ